MKIGLLGRKIGMTRVYDAKGNATPVTVIEAGDNTVVQVKSPETDGYSAVQVGFDSQNCCISTRAGMIHDRTA